MRLFSTLPLRALLLAALLLLPTAQRSVSAQGMSDPPVANDDYATTDSTTSVTIDVLSNDYGVSAPIDPTSVWILQYPSTGSATVDTQTGEIEFTPDPGAAVSDYLVYDVQDEDNRVSNAAFVWITVLHEPPTAFSDAASTPYNESVVIDVLGNDFGGTALIDPGTVTIVTAPSNGSVGVDSVTGEVTYTPNNLFTGSDWFEYVVSDTYGVESDATRVDVDVFNVPPVITWFDAWPDSYGNWVFEGQVDDEDPESCTVEITGFVTDTATPDATGHFEAYIYVAPGTGGLAIATATDELGEQGTAETWVDG